MTGNTAPLYILFTLFGYDSALFSAFGAFMFAGESTLPLENRQRHKGGEKREKGR